MTCGGYCSLAIRGCLIGILVLATTQVAAQGLDELLRQTPAAEWATRARQEGDAARGAVLFFQPHLACAKCHAPGNSAPEDNSLESLGPQLTRLGRETSDETVVEALLTPSKAIRRGYESVTIVTKDGRTLAGVVAKEDADGVVLRDAARQGLPTRVAVADIEHREVNPVSLMPAGQMNQLTSAQQFMDLVRYVFEVRDGGLGRARELQPPPSLLLHEPPEYEQHLDHVGLIRGWNRESLRRGEAIYRRVCQNCHGDHEQPGSLPNSLRFATGKFKNGSDPLSIYRTLTRGFGLMAAQTWMVPSQKYDVIHYLREKYLRTHNPTQWTEVNEAYLARLPPGDTRGPAPSLIENWVAMDYGPHLTHTFEVPGKRLNLAYKGIAVRLDSGPGGVSRGDRWMLFETDTLRVAAAWRAAEDDPPSARFVDWEGIQFNGRHGVHPRIVGETLLANANGPGWSDPASGSWADDQRVVGRDQRRYGPLPPAWGRFRGLYHHGQEVVLSYRVGDSSVLESPGWLEPASPQDPEYFLRRFQVGARARPLQLRVSDIAAPAQDGEGKLQSDSTGRLVALSVRDDEEAKPKPKGAKKKSKRDEASPLKELRAGIATPVDGATWSIEHESLCLTLPAGSEELRFTLWVAAANDQSVDHAHRSALGRATQDHAHRSALGRATQDHAHRSALGRATQDHAHRSALGRATQERATQERATQERAAPAGGSWPEPVLVDPTRDLAAWTHGGPSRWPTKLRTTAVLGEESGPFAVDTLTAPEANPWLAQLRFTGLDFFPDGRLAACTWDGDVWIVSPQAKQVGDVPSLELEWQRVATGLFQPLGLKIVRNQIHLTCRDQLAVLHDLNGDGEIDFYECLNSDHQVTEHFHEFAMGLQTDVAGNFYYAKSGRHALTAVVPQHGTLLKVTPDGQRTEILATGFRAANGVCLNPDGSFVVTDQEGFWNPKNRINWVTVEAGRPPKFYGNMFGYHDVTDESDGAMEPPLCWITNAFDRSPAELLWVDSPAWGPLHGQLLNLSYGYGKVFLVPHETVEGVRQGGLVELPIPAFPTGVMRGRFLGRDGHLYLCGMFSWAGSATHPGGLYRLRATGQPIDLPVQMRAKKGGMELQFSSPLAAESVSADRFAVKVWGLRRSKDYGSPHVNEHSLAVESASLSADGKTVWIALPDLAPTWGMEIQYTLRNARNEEVQGTIHNTVHRLQ